MAKFALIVLALVAVCSAKPLGGVGVSKSISSHVGVSPYIGGMGLGYGMMGLGYPGIVGKSIGVTHYGIHPAYKLTKAGLGLSALGGLGIKAGLLAKGAGIGLTGLGMHAMYPGGIGIGYGLHGKF